jgi:hypothetical protein
VTLTITGSAGCESKHTEIIEIKGVQKIQGKVLVKTEALEKGKAYLLKNQNNGNTQKFRLEKIIEIKNGTFCFENMPTAEYQIFIIPEFDLPFRYFPKYLPTYADGKSFWTTSKSSKIENDVDNTISLNYFDNPFYGNCLIKGKISKKGNTNSDNFGIPVLLVNEQEQIMDFCMADPVSGEYCFNELPEGKYRIHPEIINCETEELTVILSEGNQQKKYADFEISDDLVKPLIPEENNSVTTYPNPIYDILNIDLQALILPQNSEFTAKLYDAGGRLIITESGKNSSKSFLINTSRLTPGIYFLQMYDSQNLIVGFRRIVKSVR